MKAAERVKRQKNKQTGLNSCNEIVAQRS